ncbi:MAG: YwaF family protein [Clostridia bacterium]|nr:YwaF family protein [Clostridia bacterium]
MREFFGFGDYTREPEGYFSWQHLVFVSSLMVVMLVAAILLGRAYRGREMTAKNRVLIWAAILIDSFELFKIVIFLCRSDDPLDSLTGMLPLFLCSIQLITIPLAAFARGRVKEAALDFVFIFGLLGAVMGTYFAGNNYASYPVLSVDNVVSGITHAIAGFASLYVVISGMAKLKTRNIPITFGILFAFCAAAMVANLTIPYDDHSCNYMFLMRGDGTPYDIIYNLVGGNPVIYPILVVLLFVIYICAFYLVYFLIEQKRNRSLAQ